MNVSAENFRAVLSLLVEGMSVRQALRQAKVDKGAWYADLASDCDEARHRLAQYARAVNDSIRAIANDTAELADSAMQAENNVQVQGIRLAVETRKWLLSKLAPKVYGDRVDVAHVGNVTLQLSKEDASL